jgi:hypothetical protein
VEGRTLVLAFRIFYCGREELPSYLKTRSLYALLHGIFECGPRVTFLESTSLAKVENRPVAVQSSCLHEMSSQFCNWESGVGIWQHAN